MAQCATTRFAGQSLIEFVYGLILFVSLAVLSIDFGFIYLGVSMNTAACRDAAKSAAGGPPDVLVPFSPQDRANSVLSRFNSDSQIIRIGKVCNFSEEVIQPLPQAPIGGPIEGSVSLETSVIVHPPFIIGALAGKKGLCFVAKQSLPYTYIVPHAKQDVPVVPATDMWQVTIHARSLSHYLEHAGSSMLPMTLVTICYVNERDGTIPCLYETLYYSRGRAVGSRRNHALEIASGAEGSISVTGDSADSMPEYQARAIAGTIGRIILDLRLRKCTITRVEIPRASFHPILQALGTIGFRPIECRPDQNIPGSVILHVVSVPQSESEHLFY